MQPQQPQFQQMNQGFGAMAFNGMQAMPPKAAEPAPLPPKGFIATPTSLVLFGTQFVCARDTTVLVFPTKESNFEEFCVTAENNAPIMKTMPKKAEGWFKGIKKSMAKVIVSSNDDVLATIRPQKAKKGETIPASMHVEVNDATLP